MILPPDKDGWPSDLRDAVFLARAADQIGRAMFPVEWTGREFSTFLRQLPMPKPPPVPRSIVESSFPRAAPRPSLGSAENPVVNAAEVYAWNDAARPILDRRRIVVRETIRAAEAEDLRLAYLDTQSGELVRMHRNLWRGNACASRFDDWLFDWQNPLKPSRYVERGSWLFVWRDDLANHVAMLNRPLEQIGPEYPALGHNAQIVPWRHRPGESQLVFSTRPAVIQEAMRRRPSETEIALCGEMVAMAPPDLGWTAKGIAATRRRYRRETKTG